MENHTVSEKTPPEAFEAPEASEASALMKLEAPPTQLDLTDDSPSSMCAMHPDEPISPVHSKPSGEFVPIFSHYHEAVPFYQISFGNIGQFDAPFNHLAIPQWMTGFAPRSQRELFTEPDTTKCTHSVKIYDIQKVGHASYIVTLSLPSKLPCNGSIPFVDHFHFEGSNLMEFQNCGQTHVMDICYK